MKMKKASLPKYSISGMQPELLDFDDAAGEHLFIKILQRHNSLSQNMVQQITGMLLSSNKTEILRMLQEDEFLQRRVDAASKKLLEIKDKSDIHETEDSLDDSLYEAVEKLQPELAPQITGMLLELSSSVKRRIMYHPTELQEAVDRAVSILVSQEEKTSSDDLGEAVYEVVESMYPQLAEKITGMLLELSKEELVELLKNRTQLQEKAQLAYEALQASSSTS